jgi:dTDP-4-dehydrorhamnose reductase
MRVAVIGANGQLGSDIVRVQRRDFGAMELIPLSRPQLDVSIPEAVQTVLPACAFDVLINCTGFTKVDEAEEHTREAFLINAQAPRRLAAVCKAKGARFVHVSTDYVFGGERSRPYRETDPPGPLNVYGASKLMGESLARHEHPAGLLTIRVASLFGVAGSSGRGGNFVETILRLAREKGEVRVVSDVRMSPTGTADAARAILSLIEKGAAPGVYHVVNSGDASWYEFAREIIRRAGVEARLIPIASRDYPTAALRPVYSVLDNRKASAIVGEMPSWQDALDRYLAEKGHRSTAGLIQAPGTARGKNCPA